MPEPATVEVRLNGRPRQLAGGTTVADLLRQLDRDPRTVAIELNGHILPRPRYPATTLQPGDRLEVVHFVQGG